MISWLGAVQIFKERRERVLVTIAGAAPDLDGLGYVVDMATGHTEYFEDYHHYLGHGLPAGVLFTLLTACLARNQRWLAVICTVLVFHLHLACDIVGSRGPDGYQWPIFYLYPFNNRFQMAWDGQWALDAWPNITLWALCVFGCLFYVHTRQLTFFELFGNRFNAMAVRMYDGIIRRPLARAGK